MSVFCFSASFVKGKSQQQQVDFSTCAHKSGLPSHSVFNLRHFRLATPKSISQITSHKK